MAEAISDIEAPPEAVSAGLVPADALAYVSLSLDPSRPAVKQALSVADRFPDLRSPARPR